MDIDKAFVLHSMDYKDSSKILYLYSEKGHFSVIAHRVKKLDSINRFLSQNGTMIQLTTSKGSFPSLVEGKLLKEYNKIKQDIYKYSYMNHIMELVRNVVSDDLDHSRMFQFLDKIFTLMNDTDQPDILSFIFELKLLYFIGYGLNFKHCQVCNDNENLVFHVSSGGLTCLKHLKYGDMSFTSDIYNILKHLYYIDVSKDPLPQIEPQIKPIIRNIIDMIYDEFISFKTKSREIIRQIEK